MYFMYRSVPLCTLQFAVDFLSVLDGGGGGESGESVGEKRGGRVGGVLVKDAVRIKSITHGAVYIIGA